MLTNYTRQSAVICINGSAGLKYLDISIVLLII